MSYMSVQGSYNIWFETHGRRSKPSMLLLHGFTGTHLTWTGLCKILTKEYFLIVPDLPGHGRSGISSMPEFMNLDATSDNLLKLLNTLGAPKVALLGYSLGGRIALNFALKHQDRLTCLILEGASPGIQDSVERENRKAEDDSLASDIEKYGRDWFVERWENIPLLATQKDLGSPVVEMIKNERLSNAPNGLSMSLKSTGTGRMHPLWDQLGRLTIPVLLLVGEKDRKFLTIGEAMKSHIPRCTLRVVEGAGHCTHLEKPAIFENLVVQFLETCSFSGEGPK